ncbi:MAG: cytochrome c peroxidase [Sandaracinus sp.]
MIVQTTVRRAVRRASLVLACALAACDGAPTATGPTLASAPAQELVAEGPHARPLPEDEPSNLAAARLGERLFADPRLSRDGAVACTACHDLADGGDAGNRATALPGRAPGPINVPSVFNLRYQFRWSWIGRWTTMADQIDAAMRAPHAMGIETPEAVEQIREAYEPAFIEVYAERGLTVDTFHDALTQYLFSLVTPNAPFDRYLRGEQGAMSDEALAGWALFQDLGCVSCHQGVNVGGNMFQRFGVMDDYFARTDRTAIPADAGRYALTHDDRDLHVFRVPSLRNVALTAPYFHDGSEDTLEGAVGVMARYQLGRELGEDETRRLVAFLESLTGRAPRPLGGGA